MLKNADSQAVPDSRAHADLLLSELRRRSLQGLDELIAEFLTALADHLLDLAVSTGSRAGYNLHYDAMNLLKRQRALLCGSANTYFDKRFEGALNADTGQSAEGADGRQHERLDLVDVQDFEDRLAIDRVASIAAERHGVAVEAITLRVAELLSADPLDIRLPLDARQICQALRYALKHDETLHAIVPEAFEFFSDWGRKRLAQLYAELNHFLHEQGVKPGLEEEILARGSVLEKLEKQAQAMVAQVTGAGPDQGSASHEHASAVAAAETPAATAIDPANLYRSVIEALDCKRHTSDRVTATAGSIRQHTARRGEPLTQNAPGAGEPGHWQVDTHTLARLLTHLQQNRSARDELERQPSLRDYLAANLGQLSNQEGKASISPDSLNQIDLVDNLFRSVRAGLDISPDLKPALGALQIPLAKLALLEPQFFFDQAHPGRKVINQLAALSASANFPNRALCNRVQDLVGRIVNEYQTDSEVFSCALEEVNQLVAQQRSASARNIERVIKTQQGRQKLSQAQAEVDRVLRARIRPPLAPQVVVDLVANGWRDLLVLTHVKDGPESRNWQEYLDTLDQLGLWLAERPRLPDGATQLQQELEADTLVDMIEQQIATAMPTNVSHQPVLGQLREILSGQRPAVLTEIDEVNIPGGADSPEFRDKIESLPRLRRWLKRVEQLETGTRFCYRDQRGIKRRMQLAWVSAASDRFIFVNERGQRHAELTPIQLARQLARGMQPPSPADELSPVDRSMYDTLEHVQRTLSRSVHCDDLTGLINSDCFRGEVARAINLACNRDAKHALLVVDIDQFRIVNELFDRAAGDRVLCNTARLLEREQRRNTVCARLEKDSFAVLMLHSDTTAASQYAEHIRSAVAGSPIECEGEPMALTVSVGIADICKSSPDASQLIARACAAARTAKRQGRDQSVVARAADDRGNREGLDQPGWRRNIEAALAQDRFILRGQPIVRAAAGKAADQHYEILLGLLDTDGNTVSPQQFILAAERYGYMVSVDRWVISHTFAWIRQLVSEQREVPHLSINISGNSITDDLFMDFLMEQIAESELPTSKLCFEITETGTIANMVKAADFVRAFRDAGCRFSIDDFGTGMASYNYLRELPVNYVKIDGKFITEIDKNPNDYAMARSINDLAQFLGQETIAECVENQGIANTLREIGVDYLQGWGVGRPRPLADIAADLARTD